MSNSAVIAALIGSAPESPATVADLDQLPEVLPYCPTCGGEGEREEYRRNYGWNAIEDLTYLGMSVCADCLGSGLFTPDPTDPETQR